MGSGRNEFRGALSRPSEEMARDYGRRSGYQFVEVVTTSKWFLTDRLRTRSLALPTDPPDRFRRIMQFVGKRIGRPIPQLARGNCRVVLVGNDIAQWRQVGGASVACSRGSAI